MDIKQFLQIKQQTDLSIEEIFVLLALEEISHFELSSIIGFDALNSLEKKGYIVNDCVSKEFKNKYFDDVDLFEELWNTYPSVVGTRRLRVDKDICKRLYKMRIRSKDMHDKVIKAIKNEVKIRSISNSLEYMVQLPKYLRNKRWEGYLEEQGNCDSKERSLSEDI